MTIIQKPSKAFLALFCALLFLGLSACSGGDSEKTESKTDEGKGKKSGWGGFSAPTLVETYVVSRGAVATYQDSSGRIAASSLAPVYARVSGMIESIEAELGSKVQKGDVLARIESVRFDEELKKAKASTERAKSRKVEAEKEHKKLKEDYELRSEKGADGTRLFSIDEVREAELAMERAGIALAIAEEDVKEANANQVLRQIDVDACTIKSPIDGRVALRQIEAHTLVAMDSEIFKIVRLDQLEILLEVPEAVKTPLSRRMAAKDYPAVVLDSTANSGLGFLGQVVMVAPVVDQTSGMLLVKVRIINATDAIVGGTVVTNDSKEGAKETSATSDTTFKEDVTKLLAQFPPPVRKNIVRTMVRSRDDLEIRLSPGNFVNASIVVSSKPDALVIPSTSIIGGKVYIVEDSKSAKDKGDSAKTSESEEASDVEGKSESKEASGDEGKSDSKTTSGKPYGKMGRGKGMLSKTARLVDVSKFFGLKGEGFTEVLPNETLQEGMTIVWRGMEYLKDGGKVKVVKKDE